MINGKKVVSHSNADVSDDIKNRQDLVVGDFVGKRFSFMAVKHVASR